MAATTASQLPLHAAAMGPPAAPLPRSSITSAAQTWKTGSSHPRRQPLPLVPMARAAAPARQPGLHVTTAWFST